MVQRTQVTIRSKPVTVIGSGSKSDVARALFDKGYSVTEVHKAVPMAYSQAHQIFKKEYPQSKGAATPNDRGAKFARVMHRAADAIKTGKKLGPLPAKAFDTKSLAEWGPLPPTAHAQRQASKPKKAALPARRAGIGKLRTPGLPSDTAVGPCANCGHDLAVRKQTGGLTLIHVNITTEEYLAVTQFCTAVPSDLLS